MPEKWTEKYRPESLSKIVGNESAVRTMKRWAEAWLKGVPRVKALVLRGEPGTGKTSAALALANDFGWDVVEMNASDHRNAESIRKVAGMGAVSQTFSSSGEFLSSAKGGRKLIILDEADNLFGREDYGGAKAIIETIKESSQPIILIVNDFYELSRKSPAIKTLAEKVTFSRLDRRSVIALLQSVADAEGIGTDPPILERIADNAGGDLRAAVNDLQMLVEGRTSIESKHSDALSKRNQRKELETSLNAMFGAKTAKEARDATLDLDMTPDELVKWIEENIPLEIKSPEDLTEAFDALSRSDVYLGRTRRLQHYGLWSYAKEMMTGGVSLSRKSGQRQPVGEYRFPGAFIVLSRAKGARATRDAVSKKLAPHFHTSAKRIRESVLPLLCVLVRNDRELLLNLSLETELDASDVGYLLGKDPDSKDVEDVVSRVQEMRTGEKWLAASEKKASGSRGGRGLADF
jgi:replication factor C large subunit